MVGLFGSSLSFSSNGTWLAVGAPHLGMITMPASSRVFDWTWSSWSQVGKNLTGSDGYCEFGHWIALSSDGTRLAVGSPSYGSFLGIAQVFEWTDSSSPWSDGYSWSQVGKSLTGPVRECRFETLVAFSSDGARLVVGAPQDYRGNGSGFVQIFDWTTYNSSWSPFGNNLTGTEAGDWFGSSLVLSGDGTRLAVAANGMDGWVQVIELENTTCE